MNTEEQNKPDTTGQDNATETSKEQRANVQNEPHDVLVETVTPGSHTQETDAVQDPKEDTPENETSDEQESNDEKASANNKAQTNTKPDDVHVETVTPDDGGDAPEDDDVDTDPSEEKPEDPSGEKGNGKKVTDEEAADQNEEAKGDPKDIDIPTVTPGDSADPGTEVDDEGSDEHPFHDAAEAEKKGEASASSDNKENEDDADESSNKDAGPKGENL